MSKIGTQKPFGDFDDLLENAFHVSRKNEEQPRAKKPKRRNKDLDDSNIFIYRMLLSNKFIVRESANNLRRTEWEKFLRSSEMDAIEGKTTDLIKVDDKTKKAFTSKMDTNIKEISDFLLMEISSFQLALPSAIDITKQSLSIITDLDDVEARTKVIEDIMRDAVNLKVIEFLSLKIGLSKTALQLLYSKYSGVKTGDPSGLEKLLQSLKPNK